MIQVPNTEQYLESMADKDVAERVVRRGNEHLLEAWIGGGRSSNTYSIPFLMESFGDADFLAITSDHVNKSVMKGYQEADQHWRNFCEVTFTNDLVRDQVRFTTGSAGYLDRVKQNERGRVTKPGDSKLSYSVEMYERELPLTFELYNSANFASFLSVARKLGAGAARSIERLVIDEIIQGIPATGGNPNDATFVFDDTQSARKIYAADNSLGSAALNTSNMNLLLKKMREQTDMDGHLIDLKPMFLLTGFTNNVTAGELLNSTFRPEAQLGHTTNTMRSILTPIISPRISTDDWYVLCDPNVNDVIELTFFSGFDQPVITPEPVTSTRELKWSVRLAMGAAPLDWRAFGSGNVTL